MMIPLRNITACDHCGVCCTRAPCLLGSPREVKNISRAVGYDIRQHLRIEKTDDGIQVRISGAPCVFFNGRCSIHHVKPKGGREFECWTPDDRRYYWTAAQLAKIGFVTEAA